ncbi:ABC transporter permease [Kribbella sandramycini]|uniref:Transport permease protein n=1 Tax=Kribbella sandramycini TaxID=60450 RepID=A0A7Y4KVG4_9ACTN|nr:ABC transporter permease [Kribbella sandramycini]MBB6568112.1 ABC-2 type transport system permease protein [Kribbella sandramycini]NOL39294.1 ABC transporter permease [Kribbella sandramycini]
MTALPSTAKVSLARTQLEVKEFFREREQLIFTFFFPIIFLGIFAAVFSSTDFGGGVTAATYFTPGMIASGIFLTSFQSLAVTIAIERDQDVLKRLRGTPMSAQAYFAGKIGLVLTTSIMQFTLLLLIAGLLLDVDLPTSPAKWLNFLWIFVLGTASGSVLGIAFSVVPRSGKAASAVVTPIVLLLQFISGVYFVYSSLPGWMRTVSEIFPLKWLAQGMRSVFLPDGFEAVEPGGSWQLGTGAIVLSVWLVVGLVIAQRVFRWTRRDAG